MGLYDSVVITGGRGMLARAIVAALESRKVSAIALDRDSVDVTRETDVRRLFSSHKPTILINCAAHTKVDLCEDEAEKADAINGYAVGLLARAAREHGTFLVHYSTDFVFDGTARVPYRTDHPVNPLSAYGRSKLLGERLLQEIAPRAWLIIRTAWLYGRGGPSFPRTIVERARAGGGLKVVNDQVGSPTYTPDLANATLDLLDHSQTGIWNFTNSGQTSWFDFARSALKHFKVDAGISPVTTADWLKMRPKQAIRPSYSVLDIEPYAKVAGRPMRPWEDALQEFAQAVEISGFE